MSHNSDLSRHYPTLQHITLHYATQLHLITELHTRFLNILIPFTMKMVGPLETHEWLLNYVRNRRHLPSQCFPWGWNSTVQHGPPKPDAGVPPRTHRKPFGRDLSRDWSRHLPSDLPRDLPWVLPVYIYIFVCSYLCIHICIHRELPVCICICICCLSW